MTEYGRGPGSEPWHPNDPLYGDQGWEGQQAVGGQAPYGGQQHHPQQSPQAHYGGGQYGGQQAGYPQHDFNGGYDTGQQSGYDTGQQTGYDTGQHSGYDTGQQTGYDTGQHSSYDTGQQPGYDPYADPYAGQTPSYGAERPDPYDSPEAFPPPQPPGRRHEPVQETPDWDPGPNDREHAFFAGGDDDDEYDEEHERSSRRGSRKDRRGKGGKGGKKRRSGCACLVVTLVFAGGIGGVGYFGYQFYQDRFGPAEDYSGNGISEKVTVDIPKGAGGYDIANKLVEAGVVKSSEAFVSAQNNHDKGRTIQAGVYTLNKEMSAEAAIEAMLDPKSRSNLIIAEGRRNAWVYEQIDKRLELSEGTTEKYAKKNWKDLGLPKWAADNINDEVKDPLEGFLYPASYPVAKGQEVGDVLKKMVATASREYEKHNVEGKAADLDLKNPLQLVTVASLVQAEGKYKHDFEKVATVVYNRLKPNNTETYGLLDFDSTVNYLRGESKLATGSVAELRKIEDPYNTYWAGAKGLPPGPIGNPGEEAIKAAIHPAKGNWYYFVSVNADKTLFAETNEEHERNRRQYLKELEKNEQ